MNIFFTTNDPATQAQYLLYQNIYTFLKNDHSVFTKISFVDLYTVYTQTLPPKNVLYYQKILEEIKKTDLLIAEVTHFDPITTYEINLALNQGKQVIALFKGPQEPDIFNTIEDTNLNEKLYVLEYTDHMIERQLENILSYNKKNLIQRFTLLLPHEMMHYLETVTREKRISKSHYIRSLIKEHMHP